MNWNEKAADAAADYAQPRMRPVQTVSDHMAEPPANPYQEDK